MGNTSSSLGTSVPWPLSQTQLLGAMGGPAWMPTREETASPIVPSCQWWSVMRDPEHCDSAPSVVRHSALLWRHPR
jgi:hypothetical protein